MSPVATRMQIQSSRNIWSFSIGLHRPWCDEAAFARAMDHRPVTKPYGDPSDAWLPVLELAHIYDEPFGGTLAIPTVVPSRLTPGCVTVALSRDGAGESFAGYVQCQYVRQAWQAAPLVGGVLGAEVGANVALEKT